MKDPAEQAEIAYDRENVRHDRMISHLVDDYLRSPEDVAYLLSISKSPRLLRLATALYKMVKAKESALMVNTENEEEAALALEELAIEEARDNV